ncbi:hypothetical protein SAMN05444422_106179 [Halobiforma haloterrestris]|uniref:Uncharacterized protein n=1 Tax=Natronobacterium haloterrestre TaxID=148448 RepID=A0A1I1HUV2_NATHA|nr:YkgJ family cysteine cluster protein [Halobiforma haloterrestris]SFC27676.1 hypothetical protein SAMN05444422_106179 [Halobiforma haloterrestris]
MELNCEGCAACCMDWRPLLEEFDEGDGVDRERRDRSGRRPFRDSDGDGDGRDPLDDDPNFVPLTRDEVRGFLDDGMAGALTPRFWHAREGDEGVEIDGHTLAAVAGRPAFFVGLRKPPKPVAPFGREPTWLPACVFLDPETLQCRIHDDDRYPAECRAYPAHNFALEHETECERVEATVDRGTERLVSDEVDVDTDSGGLLLGTQAIGEKLFCHPRPDALEGTIRRIAAGEPTAADRAECLAVAAASSPGTLATSDYHYEEAKERALESVPDADGNASWVGPAIREWHRRADDVGERETEEGRADLAAAVELSRDAPETPGWDALE